jgi:hypothetical protein
MAQTLPALVIFQGGASASASPLERLVSDAQAAATLDLLARAASSGAFAQALLVTEDPAVSGAALASAPTVLPLQIVSAGKGASGFHFGQALREVCRANGLERVVSVGGGAMPLATQQTLAGLALAVSGDACVVANNLYSADVVAFNPASALDNIELPATDNDLAWLLHYRAGLPFSAMPRTLDSQFDLDTPTDLATLWWSSQGSPLKGQGGDRLAALLPRVPDEMPRLAQDVERAYEVMATRRAEVLVAGRVSSWVWRRLETNLPCQTRIISEERGMRASGREERGEARSFLGFYAGLAGIEGLVSALEEMCNAAFLDTRVLFAHRGLTPTPADRFASDAFMPNLITEPWLKALTEAALWAKIPLVLGGHSLVSGGVWALSERVRAASSSARS